MSAFIVFFALWISLNGLIWVLVAQEWSRLKQEDRLGAVFSITIFLFWWLIIPFVGLMVIGSLCESLWTKLEMRIRNAGTRNDVN